MPTMGILLLLLVGGGLIFLIDKIKKEKVIAKLVDSADIQPSDNVSEECVVLIEKMKNKSGISWNGYELKFSSGES